MTSKSTLLDCTNDALFQLNEPVAGCLQTSVLDFLKSKNYPWELLGSSLAQFVREQINLQSPEQRIKGNVSPNAFLEKTDSIVIHEGAIVEAGAYICGPTVIESGAVVRHGAYVRGNVYVCRNAVVGHASELKSALLLNDAKAAHFAYVGDSILGIDCNLGAGTKCANLRLDHGIISIQTDTDRISTGLKKFGAIFGNQAQTGCNAVLNPGTILRPNAIVLPNETEQGIVAPRRFFRPRKNDES